MSRVSSCPATSPARCMRWRSAWRVNARGADHNRSGAYEADLSGELDRLDGGMRPRRGRDRDRGPRGGDGLADPLQVPARRVRRPVGGMGRPARGRSPAGTSTPTSCTTPPAASSPPSTRSTAARAGRAPRTRSRPGCSTCRSRFRPAVKRHSAASDSTRWSMPTTGHGDWTYPFTSVILRSCHGPERPAQDRRADRHVHDRRRRGRPSRAGRRSTPPPRKPGSRSRSCATTSATTRSACAVCAPSTSADACSRPPACARARTGWRSRPRARRSRSSAPS